MSDELEEFDLEQDEKRPSSMTTLSVLSIISIGLSLPGQIFGLAKGPMSGEEMKDFKVLMAEAISTSKTNGWNWLAEMLDKLQLLQTDINNNFYTAAFVTIVSLSIGLLGVIMMRGRKKIGFHVYIIYCILSTVSIYMYVSPGNIPNSFVISNILFSALFIFLYSRNLKWLR
jgi:membrane-associated HD superfamily phosphohydrolase